MAKLKAEAKNILQDNYESLSYCHTMQQQLNCIRATIDNHAKQFENALKQQENNITEQGERQATDFVRIYFNKLKAGIQQQNI